MENRAGFGRIDASAGNLYCSVVMTAIAEQLERKLKQWPPTTAKRVAKVVSEIISLADRNSIEKKAAPKLKKSRREDPLFADKAVWHGSTPPDLAAKHDDYLYGDKA